MAGKRHDDDEIGPFFTGALIGAVIGVAAALWFAPQSGQETRQEIEQAAIDTRRRIEGESLEQAIQAGKAEARRYQQSMQHQNLP